jgi:hypothetical protein
MKIVLSNDVALALETIGAQTRGLEFSGFGFVERRDAVHRDAVHHDAYLYVYDYALLNVGSEAYTEIESRDILKLMERSDAGNMKLWFHRHPCGDGLPGEHNWSARDRATILNEPLGGVPKLVRWSASIVRTPRGWVGRIDNHLNHTVIHVEVEPKVKTEVFELARELYQARHAPVSFRGNGRLVEYDDLDEEDDLYEEDWGDYDDDDDLADQVHYYPESFSRIGIRNENLKEKKKWFWRR